MRSGVGDSQIIKMEIKDDFFNEGGGDLEFNIRILKNDFLKTI